MGRNSFLSTCRTAAPMRAKTSGFPPPMPTPSPGWMKWPNWGAPARVRYGPAASGKTPLACVWQKASGARPLTPDSLAALRGGPAPDAIIIDDAERYIGDAAAEAALFHLYNRTTEFGGHILLTALTPPKEWKIGLADLKSRLLAAPAAAVGSPDEQTMAVVLSKLFSDRQIFVSQDVVQFILSRIERSFAAMRDIADAVDRKALAESASRDEDSPRARKSCRRRGSSSEGRSFFARRNLAQMPRMPEKASGANDAAVARRDSKRVLIKSAR